MTVLCSFLCAARTRFKCAHRQEFEVVLCAARAALAARSAHRNRSVCVARTPPSTPRACCTHAPVLCVRARATHTTHRYRAGPPGARLRSRAHGTATLLGTVSFLEHVVRLFERMPMKPNQLQLAKCLVAELEVFAEIDLDMPGITDSWIVGMLRHGIPFTPSYWSGDENPRQKDAAGTSREATGADGFTQASDRTQPRPHDARDSDSRIAFRNDRPTWRRSGRGRRHCRTVAHGLGNRHCSSTRRGGRRRGVCGPLSQLNESYTQPTHELSNDRASPDCFSPCGQGRTNESGVWMLTKAKPSALPPGERLTEIAALLADTIIALNAQGRLSATKSESLSESCRRLA